MKVSKFTQLVAETEGKKKQVNIAQIKEIVKVCNEILEGEFYLLIKDF